MVKTADAFTKELKIRLKNIYGEFVAIVKLLKVDFTYYRPY